MKKKLLAVLTTLSLIGIVISWLIFNFKKQKAKQNSNKYRLDSPLNLFEDICKDFITNKNFIDDQDLFYNISKEFGKYCVSYEWYEEIPNTYESFFEKLHELGLYELFIIKMGEKYNKKTRN